MFARNDNVPSLSVKDLLWLLMCPYHTTRETIHACKNGRPYHAWASLALVSWVSVVFLIIALILFLQHDKAGAMWFILFCVSYVPCMAASQGQKEHSRRH